MTGFGRAKQDTPLGQFSVEIKTVNHRYSSINLKVPSGFSFLEPRLQKHLKAHVHRGQVYASVDFLPSETVASTELHLNRALISQYLQAWRDLQQILGESESPRAEVLLQLPGVLTLADTLPDEDQLWRCLEGVFSAALVELDAMRSREGEQMQRDLQEILENIRNDLDSLEALNETLLSQQRIRLRARIQELMAELGGVDEARLMMEVGLLADKADVTEELARLASHCEQFDAALNSTEAVGRRLDFLLQEMNREANTIASKNRDGEGASISMHLKLEIEKMREIAQNVE